MLCHIRIQKQERLDSNTVDNLQREADQKEISLNVLVNQILRRYVKWDIFEPKIGMHIPQIILSTCFNKAILVANDAGMSQDEIESHRDEIIKSAAELSFRLIKDSALLMKRTLNNCISTTVAITTICKTD